MLSAEAHELESVERAARGAMQTVAEWARETLVACAEPDEGENET